MGLKELGGKRPLIGSGPSAEHLPVLWGVGSEAGLSSEVGPTSSTSLLLSHPKASQLPSEVGAKFSLFYR